MSELERVGVFDSESFSTLRPGDLVGIDGTRKGFRFDGYESGGNVAKLTIGGHVHRISANNILPGRSIWRLTEAAAPHVGSEDKEGEV
jgi:hypothetical protein